MTSSKRKKERRLQRHLRNIQKEIDYKKQAWENGKLIEENHNQGPYSKNYTIELCDRLVKILRNIVNEPGIDLDLTIRKFRLYKNKIKDLILHWNPEAEKDKDYNYLKGSLETYWDCKDNMLIYLKKYDS